MTDKEILALMPDEGLFPNYSDQDIFLAGARAILDLQEKEVEDD